jgi:hypothetical protein
MVGTAWPNVPQLPANDMRRKRERPGFSDTLTRIEILRDAGDWDEWRRSVIESVHNGKRLEDWVDQLEDRLDGLERDAVRHQGVKIPFARVTTLWEAHNARVAEARDWGRRFKHLGFELLKVGTVSMLTWLLTRHH